jgi:hypothetical protein
VNVDPMGTQRQGWLKRLFGGNLRRTSLNMDVRRSEYLNLTIPAAQGEAVRAAVESWLLRHGVTTSVTAEDSGEGKTRIKASLSEADASRLDFSDAAVQSELQDVISTAVSSTASSL